MKVNSKLSSFEVFCLTNILISMVITDTTPSLIAQQTKNAFWYVPLISFISMLPPIIILLYLMHRYEAEHLVDLFEELLGGFFGKILGVMLFLLAFFIIAFEKRSYVGQIKILYFEQSPIVVIFALLTIVSIYGSIKGIKVIGYTAKLFLPFFLVSIAILIILIYPSIVPDQIFPIFGTGMSQVFREGFLKSSLFSSFILLLMMLPAVRKPKDFYKGGIIGLIISVIQIIFVFFIYTSFFDYNSIETTPFPFHEITQYVRIGDFFTNIETFFLFFWLLALFIRVILLLYLISWLFGAVFNITQFELLILPIGFLLMIIGLLPSNATIVESLYHDEYYDLLTIFMWAFPFLLLFSHFFKDKKGGSK
ncbi:GerAB/ArcD/ProY family transporter [Amphibacillus xylanus]|uniref:Putative spore germination protein n=1 Tax=Amphibacillus xylanus (strain ATCC 51415 / DSM 6626 / JCM 7361 / LMG 17667 / NBRC 15112 / Ep01) TaxID=698758 RepID=K0IYT9_AMPXN|nr:endospore germination permease [Amphibacillus xylanus]BAM46147.1 putative spore germination protein [Amphibacillus xylanus NBRC 15112]